MLTKAERIQRIIKTYEEASNHLKSIHKHGDWENWRKFMYIDIKINEQKMKLLEVENEYLYEALDDYKDY